MTTEIQPHQMERAFPGDKRCTRCGLTSATKAHKAARVAAAEVPADVPAPEAQPVPLTPEQLGGIHERVGSGFSAHSRRPGECRLCGADKADHYDVPVPVDQAARVVPAVPVAAVLESPADLVALYAVYDTRELSRDVKTFARYAVADHASGDVEQALQMTHEGVRRSVALILRPDSDASHMAPVFGEAVTAVLAQLPSPWVATSIDQVPACAIQIGRTDVDQGDQGDADVPADVPTANRNAVTSDNANDHVDQGDIAAPSNGGIMRATVNRADLVDALTYTARGIGRPSVPILSGLLLTVSGGTLTIRHFDWDTARTAEVPADDASDGAVCVGGVSMLAAVKKLDRKITRVDLVATDRGDLTVSAGATSLRFAGMPVEDVPTMTGPEVIGTIDAATFGRMLGTVTPSAGTDDAFPVLTSVRVRTDGTRFDVAATNRYQLHTDTGTWVPAEESPGFLVAPASEYLVPAKLLNEAAALFVKRAGKGAATVTVTAGWGMFGTGDQATKEQLYGVSSDGFTMITRVVPNQYPPVDGLFPSESNGMVTVDSADLVALVKQVADMSPKRDISVILTFGADGQVTAEYDVADDGNPVATGSIGGALVTGYVPEFIGLNPCFLVASINALVGKQGGKITLSLVDAVKPMIITADVAPSARVLIMPIRVTRTVPTVKTPAPATVDQGAAEVPAPAVTVADQDAAPIVDQGAAEVPAPWRGNIAAPLVTTADALVAVARDEGFRTSLMVMPAGTYQIGKTGRYGDVDVVTVQIGTPENWSGTADHQVVGWSSSSDRVDVRPGAVLHTIDQVRAYLVEYTRAMPKCRFSSDGLETAYRAVTGLNPYATSLPRQPFTEVPAVTAEVADQGDQGAAEVPAPVPADFTPYAAEIADCACPLCTGLVDSIASDQADSDRARVLLAALADGSHVRTVAEVPAVTAEVVDQGAAEVPAPVVTVADQGDQGATTDDKVRAMIAGATWSFGTGHIGKGRNRKTFRGPMMHPALDGFVPRDVWTALVGTVHALGGGAWMSDVKAFACQSSDVGTPWTRPTRSTRERAAEYLAVTAEVADQGDQGAAEVPAPAVTVADQGAAEVPTGTPTVHTFDSTGEAYDASQYDDSISDGDILSVPSERVVGFLFQAWPTAVTGESGEFHTADLSADRFADYARSIDAARTLAAEVPAVTAEVADQGAAPIVDQGAAEVPAVTVRLVYADDAAPDEVLAPAVTAEVADQGAAEVLAGTFGAHPQWVHVTDLGDLIGYRFHLVAGCKARAFRKAIGSALYAARVEFGATFAVTTPAGRHTVNVAARPGESVADWSPVLALVASILGDSIDGAACSACDRSRALAE